MPLQWNCDTTVQHDHGETVTTKVCRTLSSDQAPRHRWEMQMECVETFGKSQMRIFFSSYIRRNVFAVPICVTSVHFKQLRCSSNILISHVHTPFFPLLCLHPTVLIHIYNIIPLSPSPASHFQMCLAPPDVFFFSFFFVKSTYFQPYLCLAASIKPSGCEEEKKEVRLRPKRLFWWFPALICFWGWTQSFVFLFFGILYCLPQNATPNVLYCK